MTFERMEQLLIVSLLALCGELCGLCDFFMAHKFQDDIWESVVLRLLKHYECLRPGAGVSRPTTFLELENITPATLQRTFSVADGDDDHRGRSLVKPLSSTDTKIKAALLLFVRDVALSESLSHFLQDSLIALVRLVLPFFRTDIADTLALLAADVLVLLATHNRFKVVVALHSVHRGDAKMWGCLNSDISLRQVRSGGANASAPFGFDNRSASNDLLQSYIRDELFVQRVLDTIARINATEECDLMWKAQLKLWSHV